jgi:hypothetical protein
MRLPFLLLVACGQRVVQTEACADWVACVQARDAAQGQSTNLERFEADGACWGGDEGAALCDRGCLAGLDWLRGEVDDLPTECLP